MHSIISQNFPSSNSLEGISAWFPLTVATPSLPLLPPPSQPSPPFPVPVPAAVACFLWVRHHHLYLPALGLLCSSSSGRHCLVTVTETATHAAAERKLEECMPSWYKGPKAGSVERIPSQYPFSAPAFQHQEDSGLMPCSTVLGST